MPRKKRRAAKWLIRTSIGASRIELIASQLRSGLYERDQASKVSFFASSIVIFSGLWAMTNGANSSQCFLRWRRPAFSNRSYRGVEGNGVNWPNTGNPGAQL